MQRRRLLKTGRFVHDTAPPEKKGPATVSELEQQRPSRPITTQSEPDRQAPADASAARPKEIGGPKGPEPTRYGDWERNGKCVDF